MLVSPPIQKSFLIDISNSFLHPGWSDINRLLWFFDSILFRNKIINLMRNITYDVTSFAMFDFLSVMFLFFCNKMIFVFLSLLFRMSGFVCSNEVDVITRFFKCRKNCSFQKTEFSAEIKFVFFFSDEITQLRFCSRIKIPAKTYWEIVAVYFVNLAVNVNLIVRFTNIHCCFIYDYFKFIFGNLESSFFSNC